MNVLSMLIDKVFYGGYEAASQTKSERSIRRYSRGNILLQQGRFRNSKDTETLQAKGDKAAARIEKRYRRAAA